MSKQILSGVSSYFKGFKNINNELDEINFEDRIGIHSAKTTGWFRSEFTFEDKGDLDKGWIFEIPKALLDAHVDFNSNQLNTIAGGSYGGVFIDKYGKIFVVHRVNHFIQIYDKDGIPLAEIGKYGDTSIFNQPHGITFNYVDKEFYVSSIAGNNIKAFDLETFKFKRIVLDTAGTGDGQLNAPHGLFYDDVNDDLYISENNTVDRIQVISKNGVFKRKWGSTGSTDGLFNDPTSVFYDSIYNEVYVMDFINARVQVFDTIGTFKRKWGTAGQGYVKFGASEHQHLHVDAANNRVVVGGGNTNGYAFIQVFDKQGNFICKKGGNFSSVTQFNTGSKMGEFNDPNGVGFTPDGKSIIVHDHDNNRVQKFKIDTENNYHLIHKETRAIPTYDQIHGIDFDQENGKIFACDLNGNVVRVIDKSGGTQDRQIGTGATGEANGDIYTPHSCHYVAEDDELYVGSYGGIDKITVFEASTGIFKRKWGSVADGTNDGDFNTPFGMFYDKTYKEFYVTDANNHRIQVFDRFGTFKRKWGSNTTTYEQGKFNLPHDVIVYNNEVYVADYLQFRIQVFDRQGNFKREIYLQGGSKGSPITTANASRIMIVKGLLFVLVHYTTTNSNGHIEIYNPTTGELVNYYGGTTNPTDHEEYIGAMADGFVYNEADDEIIIFMRDVSTYFSVAKFADFALPNTYFNESLTNYRFDKDKKKIGLFPEKHINLDRPELGKLYYNNDWYQLLKVISKSGELEFYMYRHPEEICSNVQPVKVSNGYKITLDRAKAKRFTPKSKVTLFNDSQNNGYNECLLGISGDSLVANIVEIVDEYNIVVDRIGDKTNVSTNPLYVTQIIDDLWIPLDDDGINNYVKWDLMNWAFQITLDPFGNELIHGNPQIVNSENGQEIAYENKYHTDTSFNDLWNLLGYCIPRFSFKPVGGSWNYCLQKYFPQNAKTVGLSSAFHTAGSSAIHTRFASPLDENGKFRIKESHWTNYDNDYTSANYINLKRQDNSYYSFFVFQVNSLTSGAFQTDRLSFK